MLVHIYLITNEITGKYYVGQTSKNIEDRLKEHCRTAKYGRGCPRLVGSMKKHGVNAFSIQELTTAKSNEEANSLETLWISALGATDPNVGYNLCPTGGSIRGIKFSKEVRKKNSEAHRHQKPNSGSFVRGHAPNSTVFQKGRPAPLHAFKEGPRSPEEKLRLCRMFVGTYWMTNGIKSIRVRDYEVENF